MEMYKRAYEKPDFEEVKMDVVVLQGASTPGGGASPTPAPGYSEEPEW